MSDTLSEVFCDSDVDELLDCADFPLFSVLNDFTSLSDSPEVRMPLSRLDDFSVADMEDIGFSVDDSSGRVEKTGPPPGNPISNDRSRGPLRPATRNYYTSAVRNEGRPNMSKNAILARENREKKKQYIRGLEKAVNELTSKNKQLHTQCSSMQKTVSSLRSEVEYLRSVIANQSTLSQLLKNIPSVINRSDDVAVDDTMHADDSVGYEASGLSNTFAIAASREKYKYTRVSAAKSAEAQCKREHDYARWDTPLYRSKMVPSSAGVCLHVANNTLTLELCPACSNSAQNLASTKK